MLEEMARPAMSAARKPRARVRRCEDFEIDITCSFLACEVSFVSAHLVMVDYELCDLRDLSLALSDDKDVEILYFSLLRDKQEELAGASARRSDKSFDMDSFSEQDFKKKFRFHKNDIPELVAENGTWWSGTEELCVVLCRLGSAGVLSDMKEIFFTEMRLLSLVYSTTR